MTSDQPTLEVRVCPISEQTGIGGFGGRDFSPIPTGSNELTESINCRLWDDDDDEDDDDDDEDQQE